MNLMKKYLRELWIRYNPFDISECFTSIRESLVGVQGSIQSVEKKLDEEIKTLEQDLKLERALLLTIGEAIPDMLWMKDKDGNYTYANKAIRTGLLFDANPIGKNDVELAMKAKEQFGRDNHTFGEVCANSDDVVASTLTPKRFLEYGKIKGEMMYLEVHKAPVIVEGEFVGVCGTGRDLTEYINATKNGTIDEVLKKYNFEV